MRAFVAPHCCSDDDVAHCSIPTEGSEDLEGLFLAAAEACLADVVEEDDAMGVNFVGLHGEHVEIGHDLIEDGDVVDGGVVKAWGVEEEDPAIVDRGHVGGRFECAWESDLVTKGMKRGVGGRGGEVTGIETTICDWVLSLVIFPA